MKNPLRHLFTPSEQRILMTLLAAAIIGLTLRATKIIAQEASPADSLDVSVDYQITYDLHTATKQELQMIPGIGPKRAADIIAFRQEFGFLQLADLKKVKGIGEATFQRIAPFFLPIDPTEHFAKSSSDSSQFSGFPIDLNRASEKDLTRLKGIGPTRARQIIALRDSLGGFHTSEELLQIKGIGIKTLEKIQPDIIVGEIDE
jgi:competence ComEA-like helix-hairpin-helix protein